MRVLFAGTPDIALPTLNALAAGRHDIAGVLTAPDRGSGRGRKVVVSPVKARATELGLSVLQPERLRTEARAMVGETQPDAMVCVAYGGIFGPRFLGLFPRGAINLHPSLLPKYRGPAPIPAAILNGDAQTGVTVQYMAQEVDAGDILAQERVPLTGRETTGSLTESLGHLGAQMIVTVLDQIESGCQHPVAQDHGAATYTSLTQKNDGLIDWNEPAWTIERSVRAYDPWPRAFTFFGRERLNILEAAALQTAPEEGPGAQSGSALEKTIVHGRVRRVDTSHGILVETGDGLLALRRLQLQSRKPLDWRSFANGVHGLAGAILGG